MSLASDQSQLRMQSGLRPNAQLQASPKITVIGTLEVSDPATIPRRLLRVKFILQYVALDK